MANYTNCITLEQMEWLDLFDEIPYKVVKKLVKLHDETDFEVEIKDLQHDDYNKCFTSFKFTLEIDISQGSLPLMVEKHYCVIKEYNGSSPMAMYIGENLKEEEEEEEEEEDKHECECGGDFEECPCCGDKYACSHCGLCEKNCVEREKEEEEEEEWFNQQSFKGTSWNYVLDEAEKHFKCSLNSEMNDKERLIHDCLYKLWNQLKKEEEEE